MTVQSFPSGPFETNAYIVACPSVLDAAIIDPAPESAEKIIDYLQHHKLQPKIILLTHSHWDHIADTAFLKSHYNIPVFIHPEDAGNLENPGSDKLPCWLEIQGVMPDGNLEEGVKIQIGTLTLEVIHTPGHTPGGICLYCQAYRFLLSGDTLFKGTIGNISFPTARPRLMWNSLKKLAHLPPDTKVFPGHGPSTTIGGEPWLEQAEKFFGNN